MQLSPRCEHQFSRGARGRLIGFLAIITLATIGGAFANDTTAELAAGGLVFSKSDDIEMRSEDLFLSTKEIRIQYRFYNRSNRDITTLIAFPMPDIPYGDDDFNFAIPSNDLQSILPFATTVNGRPVAALAERKAVLDGVDLTEVLEKAGVSLVPQPGQDLHVPEESRAELRRLRLIKDDPGADRSVEPRWTLKTTYYWEQTFPARQELVITHRYQPSVGNAVPIAASTLLSEPRSLGIDPSKGVNRYCIDQAFLNAMVRASNTEWEQHFLEYVLVTAANWNGPIGRFRLVVDKEAPENLVSFCANGVRKINPTQFEFTASQFTPTSNLAVLILSPRRIEPSTSQKGPDLLGAQDLNASSCEQLWYRRNDILKTAGYCFRTPRAVRIFGNAGCRHNSLSDLILSDRDRHAVNSIQQIERVKGCPR